MASASVVLTFDGASTFSALTLTALKEAVGLSISDLTSSDYSAELVKREGEFIIDIFFKVRRDTPVTLTATPLREAVLTDFATGLPSLAFADVKPTHEVEVREAPNAKTMESLSSFSEASQGPVAIISTAASIFSIVSIMATTPMMTPLLQFLKIFKLISRLKLINVFFGPFLEFILMLSGMMFELGNDPRDMRFLPFDSSTRGKLTKFNIMTVSVEKMWLKYMAYFLVLIIRYYQAKLRYYIKKRVHFSLDDQVVDRIADESRVILFTVVVIDIFFYSIRCVCHMNLDIPQTRDSIISYVLSVITILAVVWDIFLLFLSNRTMKVGVVLKERLIEAQLLKNDEIRKMRIGLFKSGAPFIEEDPNNPRPPPPPKRIIKTKENHSDAAVVFFTEGIKTEMIQTAKYFNTISLVKLIVVEPLYVSLQMFPTVQIIALLSIQVSYFVYFCYFAFKKRVFSDRWIMIQTFVNELALSVFLMVGAIFQIGGGISAFSTSTANVLQAMGIVVLILSCVLGIGVLALSILTIVVQVIRKWRMKKREEEYLKIFYPWRFEPQENAADNPVSKEGQKLEESNERHIESGNSYPNSEVPQQKLGIKTILSKPKINIVRPSLEGK